MKLKLHAIGMSLFAATPVWAQFVSGSTGVDGSLDFTGTPSGTVIVLDPKTRNPPIDVDGDNVFHFTTVTIPGGVTVKLSGRIYSGPVTWLATGAVLINGIVDLDGDAGSSGSSPQFRHPSIPGAGGFPGGAPGEPGLGPGGGAVATPGTFTGNQFLVPLIGGSGGGGGSAGGGAGGGAILIASSVSIAVGSGTQQSGQGGVIRARGGNGSSGGSGGAVRLVAPTITGAPGGNVFSTINVSGGNNGAGVSASFGRVRIESFNNPGGGIGYVGPVTFASPFNTFVPTTSLPSPSVRVLTVDGISVAPTPSASFNVPDVVINNSGIVQVTIQAANVPIGTIIKIKFYCENGPDIVTESTPLLGTPASSTATATVTLPSGYSRGFLVASFTP